jgi:enoyl-CoA hydratase/carnithine racemase
MNEPSILLERDGPIATLTMNRPERRNALSLALMRELTTALRALGEDRAVRAVILAGNGPAFCAGHDLREMLGRELTDYRALFDACVELMTAVQAIPQPVIARVHGIATAAGCQLVASCDLALAGEAARFATPGVNIGLFCTTPMVALTRAVGRKRAMELLLTGEAIDAHTAADWGLVNRVVPDTQLVDATRALAARVAEASSVTVAIGKQAFYAQIDLDQPKAYAYAKEVMSLNAIAADAQEGMCAFIEKRPPQLRR